MIDENINIADFISAFGKQYISLRKKEGRLFTDQEVASLPEITATNNLKKEWDIRKASCARLISHLSRKRRPLAILEIGCGNGWLSNQISKIKDVVVTGMDINSFELEQGARVFGKKANLDFVFGDLSDETFKGRVFDIIVFAASIQYFPSLDRIIRMALEHLKWEGEIHILDSHFYKENQLKDARQRSSRYFIELGFKEMNEFYFHHSLDGLTNYNYKFLFDPNKVANKIFRRNYRFHWICIQHS